MNELEQSLGTKSGFETPPRPSSAAASRSATPTPGTPRTPGETTEFMSEHEYFYLVSIDLFVI